MQIDNDFINECIPVKLFKKGVKPFDYQYEGIKTLFGKTRFLIADDPGLGKTIQLIVAVNLIAQTSKKELKVLVIGTKSIVINWQREIDRWSNCNAKYTVINHDKLIGKNSEDYLKNWDVVIADESHFYLKNQDTLRAKMFLQVISTAERVWLSTATPASRSAVDYYMTLKILLPTLFGKWSKTQFMKKYCNKILDPWTPMGYRLDGFNQKTMPELNKVFKLCCLRRKQEEVKKDLPPLTFSDYFADVSHKNLLSYTPEEAKEITARLLEGKDLTAEQKEKLQHNALLKIPSMLELLNTYPTKKKVVIFAWHRSVVAAIVDSIKKETDRTVDFITGEVTSAVKRQELIDKFQESDLDTLVLNMQSGGVGVNLTAASTAFYMELPGSPIFWIQSLKRIHRIGSLNPVQIIKIMIPKSVDEQIFAILQERLANINEVGV